MKTVNSVSGGKTSAMMALKYPADYNIFSIVLTDDPHAAPKDPALNRECNRRIPGFVGSREVDHTLKAVLDLEQELGKEITWVYAKQGGFSSASLDDGWLAPVETYDTLITRHKALPNRRTRFCTIELKIYPIFWHTYLHIMDDVYDIVDMRIGFRKDEEIRANRMLSKCLSIKAPVYCNNFGSRLMRWKHLDWRIPSFPLIEDGITSTDVLQFWDGKPITFPKVSNCDFCFFHTKNQTAIQMQENPDRIHWWKEQEALTRGTWESPKKNSLPCQCTD